VTKHFSVLHVIIALNTGGAEHMLCKIIEHRDKTKFDVTVLSLTTRGSFSERIEASGVEVVSLNIGFSFVFIKKLVSVLKTITYKKYDVMQGWMYHANLFVLLLKLFSKETKVFWNIRQSIGNWSNEKLHAKVFIKLGGVFSGVPERIVNNSMMSIEQHELLGYKCGKQKYIPNGFECNPCAGINELLEVRVKKFCSIARFHPNKGHYVLLEAFRLYLLKADAVLVLVGKGCDSSNMDLLNYLTNNCLRDKVILMGERDDVAQILASVDIFVLPSVGVEGFSNALGEAMLAKRPCIATNVGECQAMLDGIGWIVEPGCSVSLADIMLKVAAIEQIDLVKKVNSGKKKIECDFNIKNIALKYEELWCHSLE